MYNKLGCYNSSGRRYKERVEYDFFEDKVRIINSKAFRRLEYKTQVFINYIGDHYRNRLTHSLEVSQIACYIAKKLGVNQELAEVIALAHDLGHPPFGHAGEDALNSVGLKYGGFNHNLHTIKIVTFLEKKSFKYEGLNLTVESVDGMIKHNGKIDKKSDLLSKFQELTDGYDINFSKNTSIEAQIASLADDIAYLKHDIDDGIRAKFINIEDCCDIGFFDEIYKNIVKQNNNLSAESLRREVLGEFSEYLVNNLVTQTRSNISNFKILTAIDVYNNDDQIVSFSSDMQLMIKSLKDLLFKKVYRHFSVNRINFKTKKIISELFDHFMNFPNTLPSNWQKDLEQSSENVLSVLVMDYLAGMTDRFAVEEHKKIFAPYRY
ncbi:MAG: dGTPase [Candidatus Midichloriaceae bacterium]|jgi:dGTPase